MVEVEVAEPVALANQAIMAAAVLGLATVATVAGEAMAVLEPVAVAELGAHPSQLSEWVVTSRILELPTSALVPQGMVALEAVAPATLGTTALLG